MRHAIVLALLLVACGGKTESELSTVDSGTGADTGTSSDSSPTDGGSSDVTPPIDFARCSGPGTCSLVSKTCCGVCGTPTPGDFAAVGKGTEADWTKSVCGPDPVGCPACAALIPDGTIQAWCRTPDLRCDVVDTSSEPVSACATDADCILRHAPCCEPCDESPFDLVALNGTQVAAYRAAVCSGAEDCSKCLPKYPTSARAYCDVTTKHCKVQPPPSF